MKNLILLILIAAVSFFIVKTYQNQNNIAGKSVTSISPPTDSGDNGRDNTSEENAPLTPPEIRHPVPAPINKTESIKQAQEIVTVEDSIQPVEANEQILEQLNVSDKSLLMTLHSVFGEDLVHQVLRKTDIIRNSVVFVDNLTREKSTLKHNPFLRAEGSFVIQQSGDDKYIASENADRYSPYIRLINLISSETISSVYIQNYPLFQEAYEELGYPGTYFNDRVIDVIDHLLATPDIKQPVKLRQPKVLYTYAESKIESLSSGQKKLLRCSPDQQQTIKNKLIEIRNALASNH